MELGSDVHIVSNQALVVFYYDYEMQPGWHTVSGDLESNKIPSSYLSCL